MVYSKQTWTDGSTGNTPLSAARLGKLEQGVADAHTAPVKGTKLVTDYVSYGSAGTLQTIPVGATAAQITTILTNNNAIFLAAVRDQPDLLTVGPEAFYPVSLSFANEPVRLKANLIHVRGDASNSRTATQVLSISNVYGTAQPGVVATAQIGVNAGSKTQTISTYVLPTSTTAGKTQGDYSRYIGGAVGMVYCNDYFPWSTQALSSNTIWRAENATVHGIILNLNSLSLTAAGNPTTLERHSIRGATSNVVAMVNSYIDNGDGTGRIIMPSVTGDFIAGENIIDVPSGAVVGVVPSTGTAMAIAFSGRLDFTYLDSKSPQFRLINQANTCDLDLVIKTNTEPEDYIPSADRVAAVSVGGVFYPRIKIKALSGFSRVLLLKSCHMGRVDLTARGVPNHALSPTETYAEQAYGYGVETRGTTYGTMVTVQGDNLRHLFTTNPNIKTYEASSDSHLDYGCGAMYVTVHDSVATNTFGSSFDTHEGCYKVKFVNCRAIKNFSGGREVTDANGFNNRGFGTSYENCHADGVRVGFASGGEALTAGLKHTISYRDCTVANYESKGWSFSTSVTGNAQDGTTALGMYANIKLENCSASGDGLVANAPYYQIGFGFAYGNYETSNISSSRFNGAPFELNGTGAFHEWFAPRADYRDSPGGQQAGLRVVGNLASFTITGKYRVISQTASNPGSVFRNISGTSILQHDGVSYSSALDTNTARGALPTLLINTAGTLTLIDTSAITTTPTHTVLPTVVPGSGAGTSANGATATLVSGSTDRGGRISVTTASTGVVAGKLAVLTFGTAWGTSAFVTVTPMTALYTKSFGLDAVSTTGFSAWAAGAPAASTTYEFTYIVYGID